MPATAAVQLTLSDRNALINIIAGLYQFREGGVQSRARLLDMAGVANILAEVDLNGPATDVAWEVVRRLQNYGELDTTYHALGALLAHVLTLRDLPQDNAAVIARTIVQYTLVKDPAYVADLRARYNIDVAQVRAPELMVAPAPAAPPVEPPVSFEASPKAAQALERIITSVDNFLDISLLTGAIYAAQAMCRIERPEGTALGTGFLIGPKLLLTNQHVLRKQEWLDGAVARFDYRKDANGATPAGRLFRFDSSMYYSSPATELDYALVRLTEAPLAHMATDEQATALAQFDQILSGQHRGYLPLSEDFIGEGERINIVQHPYGDPQKVVLTQNRVVDDMTETRVQYLADTDRGSSGSPVFNGKWEVIALHHSGEPYPPPPPDAGEERPIFRVNEGIPIRAILKHMRQQGIAHELPAT